VSRNYGHHDDENNPIKVHHNPDADCSGEPVRRRTTASAAADEDAAEVKQELQRAAALGASGVPTVLVNSTPLFSGAIRTELMETALRRVATHDRG
jgi:hypothetical protein